MAKFMQNKFENPKLTQSERAKQLSYSSSTLKRYRNDMNMVSPYRFQSKINNKRSNKFQIQVLLTTHIVNTGTHELERPQMTPNEIFKTPESKKQKWPKSWIRT